VVGGVLLLAGSPAGTPEDVEAGAETSWTVPGGFALLLAGVDSPAVAAVSTAGCFAVAR
jgi:hypothetical protein